MGLKISNNITYEQCGKWMTQCRKKDKKGLEMCFFFLVVVANGWTFSYWLFYGETWKFVLGYLHVLWRRSINPIDNCQLFGTHCLLARGCVGVQFTTWQFYKLVYQFYMSNGSTSQSDDLKKPFEYTWGSIHKGWVTNYKPTWYQ